MDKVVVKRGELGVIADITGATKQTVISALNFKYATELAERIRRVALHRGGVLMTAKNDVKQLNNNKL